nr:hypothetical protein [Tanacetum cinerariifolium]
MKLVLPQYAVSIKKILCIRACTHQRPQRNEVQYAVSREAQYVVILNGDSPIPTRVVDGVVQPVAPTTTEQRLAGKNKLKERGTLLMALLDKHQLKFNIYKDAKSLMEAIEKRFGGNKETKKVQKTLLKQQYENFTGSSSKSLDQIYDRLQKLISQLEILGESLSQEDINLKFLRILPTEWRTHTLIWRNKIDLEDQISVVTSVSAASTKVPVSAFPNVDNLSDARTGRNLGANGTTSIGFNMSKVECYNCHKRGHFAKECRSPRADEEPTNYDLMAFTSSSSSSFDNEPDLVFSDAPTAHETVLSVLNVEPSTTKPNKDLSQSNRPSAPIIEDWVSDSEDESEGEHMPTQKAPSFVQTSKHVKTPKSSVKQFEHSIPAENLRTDIPKSRGHRHIWNKLACFVRKSLTHLIKDCGYYEKRIVQKPIRNHVIRGTHQHYARMIHPHPHQHVVPTAVLTRSRLVLLTASRPVTTAAPQTKVQHQRPTKHGVIKGNPQHALKDKGVIDSGCSRHMTRNISYLSNFEEINRGYVAFGGNSKGGKITGK